MFRRKKNFATFPGENSDRGPSFDVLFWQWWVDSYSLPSTRSDDSVPVNPKRYTANSPEVIKVLKYMSAHKLPKPAVPEVIALLKSPFTQGDVIRTYHLIRFFQLSDEGLFLTNEGKDKFNKPITFVGAENWEHVMCYLDALLYAMFANLESFEPILFISNRHSNKRVHQLSALLRLYVSLLRSGNLITTDLTSRLCEVLSELGFKEALSHKQQDSAALFEFLTETLSMPLLTFKIDIKHGGKFSKDDDEKYSKERILFVSIPEDDEDLQQPGAGNQAIRPHHEPEILLEECLERYFNNFIFVKRELERRATAGSTDKQPNINGTITELSPEVRASLTSNYEKFGTSTEDFAQDGVNDFAPSVPSGTADLVKSGVKFRTRTRSSTLSIWSVDEKEQDSLKAREVSLPAWMFLRLLPFYTDENDMKMMNGNPESIARNSKEFVNRRPVLPICLKRYSYDTLKSKANRLKKRVIIPPVIELPEFVADDDDDFAGDFRLILESAVCHRGTSISLGHFVSAVRKNTNNTKESEEEAYHSTWYLYDDMNKSSRVVEKSFKDIFNTEWPYMLFYRLISNEDNNSIKTSSDLGSFKSKGLVSSKPYVAPPGFNQAYWFDKTNLSPIMSPVASETGSFLSSRKLSTQGSDASIPMPDIAPTDLKFVDIKNKYFWYLTDEDMNYYKELFIYTPDSNEPSVNINPFYRRNSQWSYKHPSTEGTDQKNNELDTSPTKEHGNRASLSLAKSKSMKDKTSRRQNESRNGTKSFEGGDVLHNNVPKNQSSNHTHGDKLNNHQVNGTKPATDKSYRSRNSLHSHRYRESDPNDDKKSHHHRRHTRRKESYKRDKCSIM